MDEHIARALARPKFLSTLVTGFGVIAVTLAVIGIYGMMAWSVAQRRKEIAVRVALGAKSQAVLGLVLRKALLLTAAGLALGLAAARAASGVLNGLLFGVEATDALAFAVTTAIIAVVALLASYLPARRALRVDPVTLLR